MKKLTLDEKMRKMKEIQSRAMWSKIHLEDTRPAQNAGKVFRMTNKELSQWN